MMEKCGCLPFYRLSLKDLEGPASRGFSLAWLLAFTKSFASLVISVVNKPNTLTMLSQQKFNTKVTICWCANNNFME